MSTNKSIAKATGVIGFATLCSRILGFIRDCIIARLFGIYVYAQAFVIAFKIPNLFRDLVGEGAANAAFVPVFSEYALKPKKEEFWEAANVLLNLMLIILMSITILGIVFSPFIVRFIAPGFLSDPQKLEITIKLNRILFPYILLVGLTAYSMSILNSLKRFAIPAFAPCILNISIIIFVLIFGEGIKGLALGVLIGGFLQLAIQIPILYKKGFRFHLVNRLSHPAVKTVGKLMTPRVFSSGIYQLNNFVDSIFGSLGSIVGEGGVAALYFSYRLIQFPLGIFSNALSQAILPAVSIQAVENNYEGLSHTLYWGLRTTFFVMLPASVGLMVLAQPIVSALFGGGKFDFKSVELTAGALFFYCVGLFAYGATKVAQSCFFALKDTVTPTKVAGCALIVNVTLNSILMFPLKLRGLALATSISGVFTFLILFAILKKRLGNFDTKGLLASFARILLASICMGVVCYFVSGKGLFLNKFLNLGFSILSSLVFYAIFCFAFRVSEMRDLWRWLIRKKL